MEFANGFVETNNKIYKLLGAICMLALLLCNFQS